jgi:hypothetical protein
MEEPPAAAESMINPLTDHDILPHKSPRCTELSYLKTSHDVSIEKYLQDLHSRVRNTFSTIKEDSKWAKMP